MSAVVRHGARLGRDLVVYGVRSGRWWVPVLVVVFAIAAVLALTAQTVVAPTLYVLF